MGELEYIADSFFKTCCFTYLATPSLVPARAVSSRQTVGVRNPGRLEYPIFDGHSRINSSNNKQGFISHTVLMSPEREAIKFRNLLLGHFSTLSR